MKFMILVMIVLVAGAFIKGGLDVHSAIEAGESHQAVIFGAAPMFLIGAFAILMLGKVLGQMTEAEKSGVEQDNSPES